MRVKKFEAKDMKEALRMVKNELGPDAVILSARDNRKSFGLNGESSVEITAAVSESTLQKKHFVESRLNTHDRERFNSSDARAQRQFISKMIDQRNQREEVKPRPRPMTTTSYIDIPDEDVERRPRQQATKAHANGPMERAPTRAQRDSALDAVLNDEQQNSERALGRIRAAAREAWKAGILTADEERAKIAAAKTPSSKRDSGGMDLVHEEDAAREVTSRQAATALPAAANQNGEIATLKGEIDRLNKVLEGFQKVPQTFVTMHPGADFGISYDLSFMFQKLTEAGVTVDHTVDILGLAAKELDIVQQKKRPLVDAWVARYFLTHVQTQPQPWAGRLHLFVGGSGSGKTSALVKMASHLVVKEKKRVAILTTDSFKVGAVDQLKIYCQILNVPFAVIRNRNDWNWILGQLANIDHVLVDFPGLQLKDLEEIHLLKSLLPPAEAAALCHLCVSTTTKDGDAYEIARRYKVSEFGDLIFTNLDQSVQHGIIYNLQHKTGKALHTFGIGPRIPEDFEPASKERVLDLIFKLTRLRRETK